MSLSEKRQQILELLEEEKSLTASQLAKLFLTSYSGVTRLLSRMVEDGLIRVHKIGQNDPLYYFLPTTKAPTVFSHKHEKDCADLFIAFKSTGLLKAWNPPENFEDYNDYVKAGVLPDRISIIGKSIVFWEVDRGTESYQKISDKIPNYITLSRGTTVNFQSFASRMSKCLITRLWKYLRKSILAGSVYLFQLLLKRSLPQLISPVSD